MFQNYYKCEYGYGLCKAPDIQCPHWQGIFCELDEQKNKTLSQEHFAQDCKEYRKDASDGKDYGHV